jgi:FkbM family methyltransferase
MIGRLLRKFNDFKGKQRLSRLLMNSKLKRSKDIVVEGKYNCKYLVPNIKEVIGFELYINGIFEEEHVKLILSKLKKNSVLIDLGANIGSISLPICKLRNDVSIIAVEASSTMFDYLKKNIELNHIENCSVLNKAVWYNSDGDVPFYLPDEQYGKGMIDINKTSGNFEIVKTISLDDLCKLYKLEKVDFIKVDIEGYEYFAFKGGVELLKKPNAPDILFEFIANAEKSAEYLEPGDAQSILMAYGYNLYKIEHGGLVELKKPIVSDYAMIFASKK